ncbi:MAG: hypothetical protein J6S67_15030 [Methanobrevibacter sp.]|nr:hypothetical protein [Methanobrevibacter sp.]
MANTQAKWQRKNTTLLSMRLNNYTDKDILKFLETVESKQGLVKELLRAEMERRNFVCPHPSRKEVEDYEEYLDSLERGKEVGDYENEEKAE